MALLIPGLGIVQDSSDALLIPGIGIVEAQATAESISTEVNPFDVTSTLSSVITALSQSVSPVAIIGAWQTPDTELLEYVGAIGSTGAWQGIVWRLSYAVGRVEASGMWSSIDVSQGAPVFPIKIGAVQITGVFLGSVPVTAIHNGETQLWP